VFCDGVGTNFGVGGRRGITPVDLVPDMIEVLVTTGAVSRAKLQSNHHQQTNIQFFTGWMSFLSPNQQCQSTEEKKSHSMDLLTPSSPGGLPTLSLTTNSSWLPLERVAMPPISPLMPVAQGICSPKTRIEIYYYPNNFIEICVFVYNFLCHPIRQTSE